MSGRKLEPLLDQNCKALPEAVSGPPSFCVIWKARTRKEAGPPARACAEGTVASRLARGRSLLARRLAPPWADAVRGSVGGEPGNTARPSVPGLLAAVTVKARVVVRGGSGGKQRAHYPCRDRPYERNV